jgi:two-component system sensor histidine kinase KdpD
VALTLVLIIVGTATVFGAAEALLAALVAGVGFVYYFLPPRGFQVDTFEDLVDLMAFLVTAIVTGQVVAQLRRLRLRALKQQDEAEKLNRLTHAMLSRGESELSLAQLADRLVGIFEAEGVALYDMLSGQIVRSGLHSGALSDDALYQAATGDLPFGNPHCFFAPIRRGGKLGGSISMNGANVSDTLLRAIAERVELAMARLDAAEKATEAEVVRRTEELKSAVLDAMAHEIRNPLNSIKIAATTLLSEYAGSELDRLEMLTIIDEEATRMDRLLEEEVRLARGEAKDLSLRKEAHDLARLIPEAIEEMRLVAGQRPIQVFVPESLPPAECDGNMIGRVLKQLVSNALKYSPEDSPLTVSAEFTGETVVIDVVDRGPGVNEDERERIFEKHYRGRAARRRTTGSGLGLASARSIVRAHGGEIWLTSPRGGGAAFHISLPV